MVGFPYSYGDDDNNQFIIFSLDRVSLKKKLSYASTLPIVVQPPNNFNYGDTFSYKFCDQISQLCGELKLIPGSNTLVLDYDGFCNLVVSSDVVINNLSSELGISTQTAREQAQLFFKNKEVIVQATGVQGYVYKVGSYLQSAGSAGLAAHTISLAKLAGVTGLDILKAQPALAIAIPTSGCIFFYSFGAILGNNTLGRICISTGDILALPMKGVEIMWNSYANPVVHKIVGFPVILNMTQSFKTGSGYTLNEVRKYIPLNRTSIIQSIKDKVIKWLS